jgi:quercetin dioxygenase-like cupin family protein
MARILRCADPIRWHPCGDAPAPPSAAWQADCHKRSGTFSLQEYRFMALPHAKLLDVIGVRPLGAALADAVSTSLIKTERVQLLHLVLPAHRDVPEHRVDDECTLHCLEGEVEVITGTTTLRLGPGELVVLPALAPHSLRARSDCAVLATLLLRGGVAGQRGGEAVRKRA